MSGFSLSKIVSWRGKSKSVFGKKKRPRGKKSAKRGSKRLKREKRLVVREKRRDSKRKKSVKESGRNLNFNVSMFIPSCTRLISVISCTNTVRSKMRYLMAVSLKTRVPPNFKVDQLLSKQLKNNKEEKRRKRERKLLRKLFKRESL